MLVHIRRHHVVVVHRDALQRRRTVPGHVDGVRILATIINLYRSERPLAFFSGIGIALAVAAIGLAIPLFVTYFEDGTVPRLPTAILVTGLMLLASLSAVAGLVLDTVTRGRREMKLLAYLSQRAPGADGDRRQT